MATKKKPLGKYQAKKSQVKTAEPDYRYVKGTGWEYFTTPTPKDSSDYRQGYMKGNKNQILDQFPFPSGAKIRGYNEGVERRKKGGAVKKSIKSKNR